MGFDTFGVIAPHPPIMVPEVGGARAGVTATSVRAMEQAAAMLSRFAPDAIVISSPHAPTARDVFLVMDDSRPRGDLGGFGAPDVDLAPPGDPELARAIVSSATGAGVPAVGRDEVAAAERHLLDHAVLVPMSFLDPDGRWPLVVLSLSWLDHRAHRAFGTAVAFAARSTGRKVAYVASGDLSHRLTREAPSGFSPRAREFDADVVAAVEAGDLSALDRIDPDLVEEAGECGLRSIVMLDGFLEGTGVASRVLAYEGPWGVGYLTAVFAPAEELPAADVDATGARGGSPGDAESPPVSLARKAIETFVRTKRTVAAAPSDDLLRARAGAFVSLHRNGELRGCIGTITATRDTLAEEIASNAVQAAMQDPRFPPLEEDELDDLDVKVDVLHDPETVDDVAQLDPKTYGVIVRRDWRQGLLLPDLDGVDTVEQQLEIAKRKAGIAPEESVSIERFSVERFT